MSDASSQAEQIVSGQTPQVPVDSRTAPEGTPNQAFTTDTKLHSMNDLKREAPEVHKAMMEGIAFSIVRKMQQHARRMKKLIREGQRR